MKFEKYRTTKSGDIDLSKFRKAMDGLELQPPAKKGEILILKIERN